MSSFTVFFMEPNENRVIIIIAIVHTCKYTARISVFYRKCQSSLILGACKDMTSI